LTCFQNFHKGKLKRNSNARFIFSFGAFFWDYSGIGILGTDGICVLLEAIPFSEWTEYYSVNSAPDSRMNRMNRMKGIRFTWNRQNRPENAFFWEVFGGNSYAAADIVVVLRSPPPWVFRFEEGSFRNWNSVYSFIPKPELARIVPEECTLYM